MSKTTAEGPMKLSEKINKRLANIDVGYNGWLHPGELSAWAKDASQLEQAQTWIPVETPPPLKYDDGTFKGFTAKVLTCSYTGHCRVGFLDTETGLWRIEGTNRTDVAFWMPLPPAPPSLHP